MIIDAHHHMTTSPDYADRLAAECLRLGVDRVCLFSGGKRAASLGLADNNAILAAMERYPETIVAYACFDLGVDLPERIDEFARRGFRGIKFIYPTSNYDDRAYYPVYERVQAAGIPAIFHLGIISRRPDDHQFDVDNNRHRPIYLDTIARAFPEMKLIGAHLGNPWYEAAAMAARWNPNLYFDLSGSTLKCKSARFLGDLLWWTGETRYKDPLGRHAWEKIVFGADVGCEEIEDVLSDYQRVLSELDVPQEVRAKVLGGTMAELLGLEA